MIAQTKAEGRSKAEGGLIGPTGIAYEPMRNEFIVGETFTGLIKRIRVP